MGDAKPMIRQEIDNYKEQLDKNPSSYKDFPQDAKIEREITNYALEKNPFNMWYLPDRFKNDKDYAMYTLAQYPTFHLNKLGEKLQSDKEMVMFAMKHNQTFDLRDLEHVCKHFINDKEVVDKAMEKLKENPLVVPGEVKIGRAMVVSYQGKEQAIEAVKSDPEMYRLLSGELKENSEVAMAAIRRAPYLINEVPQNLQNERFYTAAAMAIPGVKAELPLEIRRTAQNMEQEMQRPKKSFEEAVKWAKEQKANATKNVEEKAHTISDREI